ncbi:MAG: hypothetical protein R3186_07430 [Ruegeria sp.]|nr:hypothetical protein [Ruegeria sp.]
MTGMEAIFIHGLGGAPSHRDSLCHHLSPNMPRLAVTLPGHEGRAADKCPFSIERAASKIAQTL